MSKTDLVATTEAAERLGCSVRQVARLVATGRLEPVRKMPGRRGAFIFDPADVERLAAQRGGAA